MLMTSAFPDIFSKNPQIPNFVNIGSVETEMLHANNHKEIHKEADSCF
jgi:hypothetical protein